MARHLKQSPQPLAVCVGGGTGQPQVLRALRVNTVEFLLVEALRNTGSMHHVVELETAQLFGHLGL